MFKSILSLFICFAFVHSISAQSKSEFLKNNRADLSASNYAFPQTDFNIIGFGALHGSAKTYEAEMNLITALKSKDLVDYYIMETNSSQAFYFQEYLNNGDEELLKELTLAFESIVSQEGTIETFNHWKNLRALNLKYPDNPIKVIGFDVVNEYKFPIKHLLSITKSDESWTERENLKQILSKENVKFNFWNKEINAVVRPFVENYLANKEKYKHLITDLETFEFIVQNINHNYEDKREREKIIYENYLILHKKLGLSNKKQFAKYGYFHIQKDREANYPSFFTRLIENKIYDRDKIITTMCYLTKSKVLWNKKYDKDGNYNSFTKRGGFGVSDCWRERFEGIENLKNQKITDQTIFRLNQTNSPYNMGIDLVEINVPLKDYNSSKLEGKSTLLFIDYAILVSNSKAQIPIEELELK